MKKKEKIELIGYPEGNIIRVTKEELEELENSINPSTHEFFDIRWDNEGDYQENCHGQWRFINDEEVEIEEWLEEYRYIIASGIQPDAIKDIKKYNL